VQLLPALVSAASNRLVKLVNLTKHIKPIKRISR
jgi:hypothetical protein